MSDLVSIEQAEETLRTLKKDRNFMCNVCRLGLKVHKVKKWEGWAHIITDRNSTVEAPCGTNGAIHMGIEVAEDYIAAIYTIDKLQKTLGAERFPFDVKDAETAAKIIEHQMVTAISQGKERAKSVSP